MHVSLGYIVGDIDIDIGVICLLSESVLRTGTNIPLINEYFEKLA